jgi:ArsR family transcriptional regulator, zinc-responsive transcriptional repressor
MEKSKKFTNKELEQLAMRFKILSEPSRLKILRSMFAGEKCVYEITNSTKLMQANVSKQLKILVDNGIVKCRPSGLQRYYHIIDRKIIWICKQLCDSHHKMQDHEEHEPLIENCAQ